MSEKPFQVIEGGYIASLPKARDAHYSWECPHDKTSMVTQVMVHPVINHGEVVDGIPVYICTSCLARGVITKAGS